MYRKLKLLPLPELKDYLENAKSVYERTFSAKVGGEELEDAYAALQAAQKELNARNVSITNNILTSNKIWTSGHQKR
ncbi:MAG: hypothetical protein JWP88_115 [Flaviaesturariibacter sp.]|nr:hypothetical protein [Flaviaesturariibacter sp.]